MTIIAPDLGVAHFDAANIRGLPERTLPFYHTKRFALPSRKVGLLLKESAPDIVYVVNPCCIPLLASYHTNIAGASRLKMRGENVVKLKIFLLISIILAVFSAGMYFAPYLAFTKSMAVFEPRDLIKITETLNGNMAPLMTTLIPIQILAIFPVLLFSFRRSKFIFYMSLIGLMLSILSLVVTVTIEVPIVTKIVEWTPSTLPNDWEVIRDRWISFHYYRITGGVGAVIFLLIGAMFNDNKNRRQRQMREE
ncbi:hypothetical protein JCM10914_5047 [Paenibacillus sp. JCM 10914]|nr:hypothetical protein [Paenibacillus sp. JCM 10914]GAE08721.1 hypothetical protein JCM10914_5047 [Paenibacillus sp. JCM 10914]